jgi:hypothetical protein
MPTPTQFGGVFWGDYTGVAALDRAYPFWSDTRPKDLLLCPGTGTAGNPPRLCGLDTAAGPTNNDDVFSATIRGRGGLGGDASQD